LEFVPLVARAYYNIRKTTLEAKAAEKYPEYFGYDALDSGQWFKEKIGYKLEWKRFLLNANTFLFLSRLLFAGFQAPITVIDLSGPCAESEVSFIDTEKLLYAFVLMMACCCCGMFGTGASAGLMCSGMELPGEPEEGEDAEFNAMSASVCASCCGFTFAFGISFLTAFCYFFCGPNPGLLHGWIVGICRDRGVLLLPAADRGRIVWPQVIHRRPQHRHAPPATQQTRRRAPAARACTRTGKACGHQQSTRLS